MERNEKLKGNARALRKAMTKEESKLWYQFLCSYPLRFRRQYVVGNYIADFYCHQAKLVVELDGEYSALPEPGVRRVRATIPVGQCQCSGQ